MYFKLLAENFIHTYFHVTQLDPRIIRPFMAECRQTIANLDNQNMKAIKGLEDRLYALDQMIASCGRLVNEQKELAQVLTADLSRERGFVVSRLVFYMHCSFAVPCVSMSPVSSVNCGITGSGRTGGGRFLMFRGLS